MCFNDVKESSSKATNLYVVLLSHDVFCVVGKPAIFYEFVGMWGK